jgi:hypothetical protein
MRSATASFLLGASFTMVVRFILIAGPSANKYSMRQALDIANLTHPELVNAPPALAVDSRQMR